MLETKEVPPTDAWLLVSLDGKVPAAKGGASSQDAQKYTVKLEPTLFVEGPTCAAQCDPESYNPLRLRASVKPAQLRSRLRVWDVTDPAAERPLKPRKMQQPEEGEEEAEAPSSYDDSYDYDHSSAIDLEHVGYPLKAARTYAIAGRPRPQVARRADARLHLGGLARELAPERVGDETRRAGQGMVVWAPAGVTHGVTNTGSERLVLLVGIAPFPQS